MLASLTSHNPNMQSHNLKEDLGNVDSNDSSTLLDLGNVWLANLLEQQKDFGEDLVRLEDPNYANSSGEDSTRKATVRGRH